VLVKMPKANVVLADGTKVTIDGTTDEVAALLQLISSGASQPPGAATSKGTKRRRGRAPAPSSGKGGSVRKATSGPADYIRDLVTADYFKTKRGLGDVQKKLEEGGHIYAVTHLSPVLLRGVRAKELRRIKEGGTWKYVNP
jgi:hypothetical protein